MGDQHGMLFGTAAGRYEASRPEYPSAAVAWMLEPVAGPRSRVVDIGAGTGKLTRVLAGLPGVEATAVDPDATMLQALREQVPGVPASVGTAEQLPLAEGSADAAVLGQAWHWVDPDDASREIGRVVRPGGVLGLIWNMRRESVGWVRRFGEILAAPAYRPVLLGEGPRVVAPFGPLERRSWSWEHALTRSQLHDLALSRSYVIAADDERRERIRGELDALLDELPFDADGTVPFPYETVAFRTIRR